MTLHDLSRVFWCLLSLSLPIYSHSAYAQSQLAVASTTASHAYAGYPSSNAIDNNNATAWSSGVFASSSPWIELDLGADMNITKIQLRVSQSPSGNTVHNLTGRKANGTNVTVGTVSASTFDGQEIELAAPASTQARYIRVSTTQSPSWVGWYEIRVFGSAIGASATLKVDYPSCPVMSGQIYCLNSPKLSASYPSGYARVWVGVAPTGAPELNSWVFDTSLGSTTIPWIRQGTYRFDLREGATASGNILASVTVNGIQPSSKLVSYFRTVAQGAGQQYDHRVATQDHTNTVWLYSWDMTYLANQINSTPSGTNVFLDGTDIFFGGNGPVYLGASNWNTLVSQLTIAGHAKIKAVFLVDEPDLKPTVTIADINAAASAVRNTKPAGTPTTQTPKVAINYSYVGLRKNITPGLATVDWAGFDCYPALVAGESWDSCGTRDQNLNAIPGTAPSIPQYLSLLLSKLNAAQKAVLFPQTYLLPGASTQTRQAMVANINKFRNLALSEPRVVAVVDFIWKSFDQDGNGTVDGNGLESLPDTVDVTLNALSRNRSANNCLLNPTSSLCQ